MKGRTGPDIDYIFCLDKTHGRGEPRVLMAGAPEGTRAPTPRECEGRYSELWHRSTEGGVLEDDAWNRLLRQECPSEDGAVATVERAMHHGFLLLPFPATQESLLLEEAFRDAGSRNTVPFVSVRIRDDNWGEVSWDMETMPWAVLPRALRLRRAADLYADLYSIYSHMRIGGPSRAEYNDMFGTNVVVCAGETHGTARFSPEQPEVVFALLSHTHRAFSEWVEEVLMRSDSPLFAKSVASGDLFEAEQEAGV